MTIAQLLQNLGSYLDFSKRLATTVPGLVMAAAVLLLTGPVPNWVSRIYTCGEFRWTQRAMLKLDAEVAGDPKRRFALATVIARRREYATAVQALSACDAQCDNRVQGAKIARANLDGACKDVDSSELAYCDALISFVPQMGTAKSAAGSTSRTSAVVADDEQRLLGVNDDFGRAAAAEQCREKVDWAEIGNGLLLFGVVGFAFGVVLDPVSKALFLETLPEMSMQELEKEDTQRTRTVLHIQPDDASPQQASQQQRRKGQWYVAPLQRMRKGTAAAVTAVAGAARTLARTFVSPKRRAHREPDSNLTAQFAIGRGLITDAEYQGLIDDYFRFSEITIGLVLPVLAIGAAMTAREWAVAYHAWSIVAAGGGPSRPSCWRDLALAAMWSLRTRSPPSSTAVSNARRVNSKQNASPSISRRCNCLSTRRPPWWDTGARRDRMLIVAHRVAFDRTYGAGAWDGLAASVTAYADAIAVAGIRPTILYLDKPSDSGWSGVPATSGTSGETAAASVRRAVHMAAPHTDAVLLLGGDEALPMVRLAPVPTVDGDIDTTIPTDNPYGCSSDDEAAFVDPVVPVGRLAAGAADGVELIAAQLDRARAERTRGSTGTGAFVLSNTEWLEASHEVASAIGDGPLIFASSPNYAFRGDSSELDRESLFFNLHGAPGRSNWFGRTGALTWTAVSADQLEPLTLSTSVAFACSCYAADIAGRSAHDSMALALVRAGVVGVVAATGFAFGADSPQGAADFSEDLAQRFFQARAQGVGAGQALWQSRRAYIRERLTNGALDNRDFKTALQFVFLGDPLL